MPKRRQATSKPTKELPDNTSGKNVTNILTILGVLVVAILGAVILFQSGKLSLPSASRTSTSYDIDGINVKTTLSQVNATTAIHFLKEAVPPSRLPKILSFQFLDKGNAVKGDSYIASWRQEGMTLSMLAGLDVPNTSLTYMRIWVMDTAKPLSDSEFVQIPKTVFNKSFLDTVGTLSCNKISAISPKDEGTVCPKITAVSDGSLRGITVRTPVTLETPAGTTPPPGAQPPSAVTIISACWISQAIGSVYPETSCL